MRYFDGFPDDLYPFLRELAQNNNRAWFQANKPRYRDAILEPGMAFIEAIGERLREVSPHFRAIARSNGGSMFRIYRDARYARDGRPYKENIGFHFRHERGRDVHAPGYYVHLEPEKIFIGCGIWMPPSPSLAKIRAFIDDNPAAWTRARDDSRMRGRFGDIEGDRLKRPPRGFKADHPLIEDLKRKSFHVMQQHEPQLANTPELVDEAIGAFLDAAPMMAYLCMALEVDF
ncbi:MAG: DUF2461 domain-containing protein [Gammaproteobacteria bacterium]|jgi:uncharacterized protein (TIGR02453 family)